MLFQGFVLKARHRVIAKIGRDNANLVVGAGRIDLADKLRDRRRQDFLLGRHRRRVVDDEEDVDVLVQAGIDNLRYRAAVALLLGGKLLCRRSTGGGTGQGNADVRRGTGTDRGGSGHPKSERANNERFI